MSDLTPEKPTNNEDPANGVCTFCRAPLMPIPQGKICLNGHLLLSLFDIWPITLPGPATQTTPPIFSRWEEPIKAEGG